MVPNERWSGLPQWFVEHAELLRAELPDERELARAVAARLRPPDRRGGRAINTVERFNVR